MLFFVSKLIKCFYTVLQRPDVSESGISSRYDFRTHGIRGNREVQSAKATRHCHSVQARLHHCIQILYRTRRILHTTISTVRTLSVHSFCIGSYNFATDFTCNFQYFIVRVYCILEIYGRIVKLILISVIAFFQFTDTLHHRIVQVVLEFRYVFIKVCHNLYLYLFVIQCSMHRIKAGR